MMLTPGSRLGAYEILSSLGAGGMGEVYRGSSRAMKCDTTGGCAPTW
jgi:serine/threonine protein kinase